jgi:predicted CXXCH cytochrome family protein
MVPEVTNRSASIHWPSLRRILRPTWTLFVLAITALPAAAKTHPVPLDKNVDAAKCLECHEQKAKGKAVHSAIATGCLSCHEVRVTKDVTRVKLTTTTTQALCLSCHDEKKFDPAKTMHPPAVRDCVKCHFGRNSRRESLPVVSQDWHRRSKRGQPPRGARYGMRHLPRDAQER